MGSGFYTILLVIHSILVIFLIVLVLLQRTDSDGLSGLSGGGGNQFLTGRGAANLLTRTTAFLAAGFMTTSLILAVMASHISSKSILDTVPVTQSMPKGATVPNDRDVTVPTVPKDKDSTRPNDKTAATPKGEAADEERPANAATPKDKAADEDKEAPKPLAPVSPSVPKPE